MWCLKQPITYFSIDVVVLFVQWTPSKLHIYDYLYFTPKFESNHNYNKGNNQNYNYACKDLHKRLGAI